MDWPEPNEVKLWQKSLHNFQLHQELPIQYQALPWKQNSWSSEGNMIAWSDNLWFVISACKYWKSCKKMLSKNANFSMPIEELINIYCLYIRSVAEQSSVVWSSSLTQGQDYDLERVQKVTLRIILDEDYHSYEHSLFITGLKTLKERRSYLSFNFALMLNMHNKWK